MPATYDEIMVYAVPSDTGSVTLGSGGQGTIPQTYTDLVVIVTSKDTRAISGACDLTVRWNGYTSNYSVATINGITGSAGNGNSFIPSAHPGANDQHCTSIWHFSDYRNANKKKQVTCQIGHIFGSDGGVRIQHCTNTTNNNAITSITFTGENGIKAQSVFKMYGILEA